ncbi:MAG: tetraacyldisaccharide 4'-kinase [Sinobacterium sp.]|nr:tetraacyldisaccharide 4'-kinase [Sinobacterium sp.]
MSWFSEALQRKWYSENFSAVLLPLLPLTALFRVLSQRHKITSLRHTINHAVPVWVVGNISVGGTGKTPVTLALVQYCAEQGVSVGIVSRGYGGSEGKHSAFIINAQSTAEQVGDEPLLMYKRLSCPVVVAANRNEAVTALLDSFPNTQLIISDDGLQHYSLARQLEIVVVDGQRGLGNGALLPAGPLRELAPRLAEVDIIIHNGEMSAHCEQALRPYAHHAYEMLLVASPLKSLHKSNAPSPKKGDTVHAVAGIGNPSRFFTSLRALGFTVIEHSFADHHDYQAQDVTFDDSLALIMTEKDAVKCMTIEGLTNSYYLPVDAQFSPHLYTKLDALIKEL